MPYKGTWRTWPVVWMDEDRVAYAASEEFHALSITIRNHHLHKGLCFGRSIQWLRRLFDHPHECPLDRVGDVVKHSGRAAATQFIYDDILMGPRTGDTVRYEQAAEASTRVSRLRFQHSFSTRHLASPACLIRLEASLQSGHRYLASFYGVESQGRLLDALFSVFGSCLGLFFRPIGTGHTIVLDVGANRSCKFFDPNFGEFEIAEWQFGRFFQDFMQRYKTAGNNYRSVHVYRVMRAEDFVAPSHNHLGRTYDWIGSD